MLTSSNLLLQAARATTAAASGGAKTLKRSRKGVTVHRPHLSNSMLRLRSIHNTEMTKKERWRSDHGIVRTKFQTTAAHLPSLYVWLQQVCGISYTEAERLVSEERLIIGGEIVKKPKQLQVQVPFELIEPELNPEIITEVGERVQCADRKRHRESFIVHLQRGQNIQTSLTDPRSFIHIVPSSPDVPINSLQVPGFGRRMSGLVLATSDVSLVPLWRSSDLGLTSTFRVTPAAGAPREAREALVYHFAEALDGIVVSPDMEADTPRECFLDDETGDVVIRTPFLPKSAVRGAFRQQVLDSFKCVQLGPFELPEDLKLRHARAMIGEEIDALYDFEKQMKVNKLVVGLREVEAAAAEIDEDEFEDPRQAANPVDFQFQ